MTSTHLLDEEHAGRLDWRIWRRLLAYVLPYRRQLTFIILAGMGTAACDAMFGLLTRSVFDAVATHGAQAGLAGYALAYVLNILGICTCIYLFILNAGFITTHVSHDLRRDG